MVFEPSRVSSFFGRGQWGVTAIAAVVLLALSFVFGGASREHAVRLALVEIAALPLLVLGLQHVWRDKTWREHRLAFGILAGLAAIPLIQLIPLPPGIWTALPGRDQLVLALSLAEIAPSWAPLSLAPDLTWRAFLALLPPLAMFLAVLFVPQTIKRGLVWFYLGAATCAVCLGMLQLASGGTTYYPWATTAAGNMVGFFANRNHLGTLLLTTLPFAATLAGSALRRKSRRDQAMLWLGALYVGLIIVALGVIRSRAGLILAGPALTGAFLAAWVAAGRGRPGPGILALAGAAGAAIIVVSAFALGPIMARFDTTGAAEGRYELWPTTIEAANTYLPLGSGLGSFNAVFRSVEPLERLDPTYSNQAHNEYLEIWLETGWLGIALIVVFLVWWGRRSWACWRAPSSREHDLQRAASVAILVMLLHSVADYPLRTEAMAVIFALCAALLEGAGFTARTPEGTRSGRSGRSAAQAPQRAP